MNHRRATLAQASPHSCLAKVAFPEFFAQQVKAEETLRTEPAIKSFAVGRGRGRREAVVAVMAFVGDAFAGNPPPSFLARLPIAAEAAD